MQVFTGAPGDLGGAQVVPAGLLLQDGNTITPIAEQHTAAPTKLKPPEQYSTRRENPIWEYASAPFAFSIAPGLIAPGNDVLIVQTGHSAYVTKVAQACPDQRSLERPRLEHRPAG